MLQSAQRPDSFRSSPRVEINLDNLLHNFAAIRAALPSSVGIIAVVKDNAYGCGSVMVSRLLEQNGVRFFAVARTSEARVLREAGVKSPVLVLGPASAEDILWGASAGILFTVGDLADLAAWKKLDVPVRFHLEIDTGMGRLGLLPREMEQFTRELSGWPNLIFEGAFTHFARSDDPDPGPSAEQLSLFGKAIDALAGNGVRLSMIHFSNSAALLSRWGVDCTMVRPGIALYGCSPDPGREYPLGLKPVMSLKGRVVKMKRVPAGTPVSYGGTYVTREDTTIATIDIGYGVGFPRQLSNRGSILIRGRRYAVAGRVTMDFLMVDAGPAPAFETGDEAVAVGSQGNEGISPDTVALECSTIGYEIMCSISSRIDRYYILGGRVIHHEPFHPF